MKKLIKFFLLSIFLSNINGTVSYANDHPIEVIRRNTENSNLMMWKTVSSLYILYIKNSPINDISYTRTNEFGHAFVRNNNSGAVYDSGNDQGGSIRQKYQDCALHSINNFFVLTQIGDKKDSNGRLYYSDFTYTMRDNLNMYIVYYF